MVYIDLGVALLQSFFSESEGGRSRSTRTGVRKAGAAERQVQPAQRLNGPMAASVRSQGQGQGLDEGVEIGGDGGSGNGGTSRFANIALSTAPMSLGATKRHMARYGASPGSMSALARAELVGVDAADG